MGTLQCAHRAPTPWTVVAEARSRPSPINSKRRPHVRQRNGCARFGRGKIRGKTIGPLPKTHTHTPQVPLCTTLVDRPGRAGTW